jgi:hypothetical protein
LARCPIILRVIVFHYFQGLNTAQNAFNFGIESGRKVLDFGGNQVNQWTGLARDSFGCVIDLA